VSKGERTAERTAFGSLASTWQERVAADACVTIADATQCASAVGDIIERRLAGGPRDAMLLFEEPRRMLLRAIRATVARDPARDSRLRTLGAIAGGGLTLNARSQAEFEKAFYPAGAGQAFMHLTVAADRTFFRSHYELESASRWFGFRPTRTVLYSPSDPAVPSPAGNPETADTLAIWSEGVDDGLLQTALDILADVRLQLRVVRAADADAAHALGSARVVVSLSDDPATAVALAAFGRPLCVATPAALEVLDDVTVFDVWSPIGMVDAVLRALARTAPRERPEARLRRALPPPQKPPAFEANAPLVSIVMTVYNRLEHLGRNLERLQKQTYANVEIVVVSNDGPRADHVCAPFGNVRYIHRERNSGDAAAPRNDGIRAARGRYVAMLDDDDFFFPDHVARMVEAAQRGAKIVYSDFALGISQYDADGSERYVGYDVEKGDGITPFELLVTNRLGYMTIFAERSVYDAVGTYDLEGAAGNEEVELWLRMAERFPMAHVDRLTTLYTIRKNWEGSLTSTSHLGYADGYERVYRLHPIENLPLIAEMRERHVSGLRTAAPAPREPRYPAIRGIQ
jgi:glycosyltransferase involved in cell wall biosynthesis